MPPRLIVPALLVGALTGVTLGSLLPATVAGAVAVAFLGTVFVPRSGVARLAAVACLLATLRVVGLAASHPSLPHGTTVAFLGTVAGVRTEPDATVRLLAPETLHGQRLRVVPPVDQPFSPGDRITGTCWTGNLPTPRVRWALMGIVGSCYRVRIDVIEHGRGFTRTLAAVRSAAASRIRALYPEPASDFLEGILVGAPPNGSPELTAVLRTAGVSHLVAVSGYNLTVLIGVLGAMFLPLAGRRLGSILLALGLFGFAGVSGFEPSVLRAGAMAGLQLAAYLVARPAALPRLLALSVLVLVWIDPGLLLFDLGFQLSVAATAGIAFLARPLERRLGFLPEALGIRTALATSFAALFATVPVLIATVGRLSFVAPITTALLTPFIPPAMALGALSLPLHALHPMLGMPAVAVEQLLLDGMLAIARAAAGIPFAATHVSLPAGLGLVVATALAPLFRRRRLLPALPGWGPRP